MTLDERIARSANLFYWVAAVALATVVFSPFLSMLSWAGSGVVNLAGSMLGGKLAPIAYAVDALVIVVFAVLGFLARLRYASAFVVGMILYGLDGLAYFSAMTTASNQTKIGSFALFAGLLSTVHIIILYALFFGLRACLQYRTNASLVHQLAFEAALKRKLEEDVSPPPPPATFHYGDDPLEPPMPSADDKSR